LRKGLYLLLLVVLCAGCTKFVKEPIVNVRELNVLSLDGSGAKMELYLTVKNTNPYDIKLLGYSYDLKVMALPLSQGAARDQVSFPAGAETDLRIPIRLAYGDMLQIFTRRPDFERVPYQLQAGLDLDTPLGKLSVPVNRTGTYAVPKQYRPSSLLNRLGDFLK
jgi:LEA14-like dessication related protein